MTFCTNLVTRGGGDSSGGHCGGSSGDGGDDGHCGGGAAATKFMCLQYKVDSFRKSLFQ